MKIINGIKKKGKGVEISGSKRDELPEFFKQMGYKTGVEVGVYKGEYTRLFCEEGLYMYGVDPWARYSDYHINRKNIQDRLNFLYEHTQRVLAPYKNVKLIRKKSMDALADFKDNSLDFVYIDGNHSFRYVAADIEEWAKKVRPGGCVSGHDYSGGWQAHPQDPDASLVKFVVDAYTMAFNIKDWYILGKQGQKTTDKWRSWLWIKE